mgnify:CR=1 FL=1
MINFEFHNPTKVIFGKNVEAEAGKEIKRLGGHKVLVHFGGDYLQANGTLDRIHKGLTDAGLEYVDLDGVVPNPRLSLVKIAIKLCKKECVDFILPIGGGSAIDSAKGIAYGLANDFELEDLLMGKVQTDKLAPIGCISTIAATGSETSNSMVITIEEYEGQQNLKRSYNHDCARPLFACMNPELTYTLPVYQTASGASDIMMHTMERYFTNTKDVDLIDRIAEGLLVAVREAAQVAVKTPDDYEARAGLEVFHTMALPVQDVSQILLLIKLSMNLAVCLMWLTVQDFVLYGEVGLVMFIKQILQDLPSLPFVSSMYQKISMM